MPDGAINEDFPHIANALSGLLTRKEIVPVVLVGIPNTVRRRDLTGPTEVPSDREVAPVIGGSEKFRRFIREELIPEIERRYVVTTTRSIIGESLAGLFVMETFFLEQEVSFHGYAAISPSLWWCWRWSANTSTSSRTRLRAPPLLPAASAPRSLHRRRRHRLCAGARFTRGHAFRWPGLFHGRSCTPADEPPQGADAVVVTHDQPQHLPFGQVIRLP
jgi:predicted alpha/beta superfamily hydrolase